MRKPIPIPDSAVERLSASLKQARTKNEYQRVLCVWLRAKLGMSADQVAKAIGWHISSVRRIHANYLKNGEDTFKLLGRGGRRNQNLSKDKEAQLLTSFRSIAEQGGVIVVRDIKTAYEKEVGHKVSKSTVYRMLERQGWRKITPRPRHSKADPELIETLKKTSP